MTRRVFFSFHYNEDACRVAQIRNIGVIEGEKVVHDNEWEEVRKKDSKSIEKWIEEQMGARSCAVVCIGTQTASRPWVKKEIEKAWNAGKGIVGIYIHNLKHPQNGQSPKGLNPFNQFTLEDGRKLVDVVKTYDPSSSDAYGDIAKDLDKWVNESVEIRNKFPKDSKIKLNEHEVHANESTSGTANTGKGSVGTISNPPKQWYFGV